MKLSEPGQWNGGRLYNPEDGRDYKGSLQLRSDSTVVVSGCELFLCQTQVWRRADPGQRPPVAPLGSAAHAHRLDSHTADEQDVPK